jgi:hypothetical protein
MPRSEGSYEYGTYYPGVNCSHENARDKDECDDLMYEGVM